MSSGRWGRVLVLGKGEIMLEQLKFPSEIAKEIAENEKKKRKFRKLTQKQLSQYSGVSLPSLKRFEQTGEISLISLLKIASVLDESSRFAELFTGREYQSIQEVIDERNQSGRR